MCLGEDRTSLGYYAVRRRILLIFADGGDSNVASLLATEKEGVNLTNEL